MVILNLCVFSLLIKICFCGSPLSIDDTIIYKLQWPGELRQEHDLLQNAEEVVEVTSANNEKYECSIPGPSRGSSKRDSYPNVSPIRLLNPLFVQKVCSYRIESYWSYELCHGRYIRQYHEEREGKKVKVQEYFLGRWSKEKQLELEAQMPENKEGKEERMGYKKIDGINLPYLELEMTDGTICEINGKPRVTRVQYVCYTQGKHEVYSYKETWTCEYEIVVLSPFLCSHPKYKPLDSAELTINCIPKGSAPKKPRSLLEVEADNLKYRNMKLTDSKAAKDVLAVFKVEQIGEDGDPRVKIEIHPLNLHGNPDEDKSTVLKLSTETPPPIEDTSPVRAFLDGENCLNGGTGWWKYEFCYGRSVEQYHIDRSGTRQSLLLGKFHESDHIAWILQNPHKRPKPKGQQRTQISHLYSGGSICDMTGKPRQTEVKLKCLENSSSPGQVSLYLLEPKTCQYILGVESPLICDILHLANDDGLIFPQAKAVTSESSREETGKTSADQKSEEETNTVEMDVRLAND